MKRGGKMKIAFIAADTLPIPSTKGGATETLVTHLINCNSLKKEHDFIVYSYWDKAAEDEGKKAKNAVFRFYKPSYLKRKIDSILFLLTRVFRKLTNGKTSLRYGFLSFVLKDFKQSKPDVVVIEGNTMHVRQLAKRNHNCLMLHIHADVLNDEVPIDRQIIAKNINYFIAVSNFEKQRICSLTGSDDNIFVLKNVIDNTLFDDNRFSISQRENARTRLNIYKNDFVLIYCGRVVEQKGVLDIVKAVAKLPQNVKLIVVGSTWFGENVETPFIAELKNESLKIGDRIQFTGYVNQSDLPLYYSISDLAVFPSRYNETAGLVVLEALSCSVPVVVPNFAGMYEFAPQESSYSIDTKNNCEQNIIGVVNHILNNKEEYEQKKKNARSSVLNLDLMTYYEGFCSIMKEVVKK